MNRSSASGPQRPQPRTNAGGTVAAYVEKWAPPPARVGASAIDAPCGRGRHSFYMAELGYSVIAADLDRSLVASMEGANPAVHPVVADLELGIPAALGSTNLALVIHFWSEPLLRRLPSVLTPGGRLIFQSYPGHGENWRQLPRAGEVRRLLEPHFDIVDYRERKVGPAGVDAVTVSAVADRRD